MASAKQIAARKRFAAAAKSCKKRPKGMKFSVCLGKKLKK